MLLCNNHWKFWIFQYYNLETNFLKTKTFFKKLKYSFYFESTKTESARFPFKIALSEASIKTYSTAFEIQVLIMSAVKCWGDFRIFQFASAIRRQKNYRRLRRNLCTLAMALAYLAILPRTMICFFNSWHDLFYLSYTVYNTLEWVKRKTIFLLLITLFWFFVCPPMDSWFWTD